MQCQEKSVKFKQKNGKFELAKAKIGETVLDCAKKAGVPLDAPCAGNGTCGKCRVLLVSGAVEADIDEEKVHKKHISAEDFKRGWRLACALKVRDNLEVEAPETASAFKNSIKVTNLTGGREKESFDNLRKAMKNAGISLGVGISTVEVTTKAPTIDDARADLERVTAVLTEKTSLSVKWTLFALKKLPKTLRENEFSVNIVLKQEKSGGGNTLLVLDVREPQKNAPLYAFAIDIGTTTVAICLIDLVSGEIVASANAGNAQIRYGADVINRMIEAGRPGGLPRLSRAVLEETLYPLFERVCEDAGILLTQVYRAAIAGNTTMLHLFLGVPPDNVRLEPYVPAFFDTDVIRACDIPLPLHPDAEVVLAPNIGSYVGGDITAGVFASFILAREEFSLFIDLGTNGELVFGNKDFSFACACSAGPAFEGGDISCGMRATDGAIEALSIDDSTLEPSFTIVGGESISPLGLCGSGLIDAIGELFRVGMIDAQGKFTGKGARFLVDDSAGIKGWALYKGQGAESAPIVLSETDIDNFIRAKGALFSAIRTMLAMTDFSIGIIDGIYIAGGIGSGIDIEKAVRIGMLPNLPLEKFHYIGNTSLQGAWAAAVSKTAAEKIHEISSGITYLELSSHPGYMDEFTAACFLPHTDAGLFERG